MFTSPTAINTHGILNPLPMVYPMVFWPPYPWYIDPPTHGILNPLPMVYRPPYPWYFVPPTHRISTPYTWYFDLPAYLLIRNWGGQNTMGVQFTIQGGSVFNKGVQYTMDVNRPRVQFTMGFKIPYDTGFFCEIFPSADLYFDKRSHLNLFLWNHWTKLNQTWQG